MFLKAFIITLVLQGMAFFITYVTGISYGFITSLYLLALIWLELSRNNYE